MLHLKRAGGTFYCMRTHRIRAGPLPYAARPRPGAGAQRLCFFLLLVCLLMVGAGCDPLGPTPADMPSASSSGCLGLGSFLLFRFGMSSPNLCISCLPANTATRAQSGAARMAEEAAAVWAGLVRTCGDPRDLELAARRVLQEHAQPPSLEPIARVRLVLRTRPHVRPRAALLCALGQRGPRPRTPGRGAGTRRASHSEMGAQHSA